MRNECYLSALRKPIADLFLQRQLEELEVDKPRGYMYINNMCQKRKRYPPKRNEMENPKDVHKSHGLVGSPKVVLLTNNNISGGIHRPQSEVDASSNALYIPSCCSAMLNPCCPATTPPISRAMASISRLSLIRLSYATCRGIMKVRTP